MLAYIIELQPLHIHQAWVQLLQVLVQCSQEIPWKLPRTPEFLNVQIGLSLLRPPKLTPTDRSLSMEAQKLTVHTRSSQAPARLPFMNIQQGCSSFVSCSLGYKTDMTCVNIYSVTINSAQYAKSPRTLSSHILIQYQHNRIFTDRVQNTKYKLLSHMLLQPP